MDKRQEAIDYLRSQITLLQKKREIIADKIRDLQTALEQIEKSNDGFFEPFDLPDPSGNFNASNHQSLASADDFRLTRFKGISLKKVVLSLLTANGQAKNWSIDDFVREIYFAKDAKAKKACRASITAVLHRLKKTGDIEQVSIGVYKLPERTKVEAIQ